MKRYYLQHTGGYSGRVCRCVLSSVDQSISPTCGQYCSTDINFIHHLAYQLKSLYSSTIEESDWN